MTLSNADKLRFAEVEDRIAREFGDSDTMDFLEYLKQQDSKTRTFSHLLGDQDRVIADFTMEVAMGVRKHTGGFKWEYLSE